MLTLPDYDVFVIDANASPPAKLVGAAGAYSGIGTILYNMAVNPVSGAVYVSNTEAFNERRFAGSDTNHVLSGLGKTSLRGRFAENRISIIKNGTVITRNLDKHVNPFTNDSLPNAENDKSLALPQGMAVSSNGNDLYVAALGSDKVGFFKTAELEADTLVPSAASHIPVTGGGPTGLVLDETRGRLYAVTRFDNGVSVIDTTTRTQVAHVTALNPEPPAITAGRRFLYDARISSSHGDTACATCHVYGDFDSLSWDLGDPDDVPVDIPGAQEGPPPITAFNVLLPPLNPFDPHQFDQFNPLKGPMTTQSLRGMANHGPMHWRGDRTGGGPGIPNAQPDTGTFDERAAFLKFDHTFEAVNGRVGTLSPAQMHQFADFALEIMYPPNPIRALDQTLTADQAAGKALMTPPPEGTGMGNQNVEDKVCFQCHVLDPAGNAQFGVSHPGFFGSDGKYSSVPFVFTLKIPHFRNMYQKVGMFGFPSFEPIFSGITETGPMGPQVRGFGFNHDGAADRIFHFLSGANEFGPQPGADVKRKQVEQFLFAFDSNFAPAVGQQVLLRSGSGADAQARLNLLIARAQLGEGELIVKTVDILGRELGFVYTTGGLFRPDRQFAPPIPVALIRLLALVGEVNYTLVPPGSGRRLGIDADADGALDGDERDHGSNPFDPNDVP